MFFQTNRSSSDAWSVSLFFPRIFTSTIFFLVHQDFPQCSSCYWYHWSLHVPQLFGTLDRSRSSFPLSYSLTLWSTAMANSTSWQFKRLGLGLAGVEWCILSKNSREYYMYCLEHAKMTLARAYITCMFNQSFVACTILERSLSRPVVTALVLHLHLFVAFACVVDYFFSLIITLTFLIYSNLNIIHSYGIIPTAVNSDSVSLWDFLNVAVSWQFRSVLAIPSTFCLSSEMNMALFFPPRFLSSIYKHLLSCLFLWYFYCFFLPFFVHSSCSWIAAIDSNQSWKLEFEVI